MMTKVIGLTGGIGSGKTTAAKIFERLGVPVYYADDAAKTVMETKAIREQIREEFGESLIDNFKIDRRRLAEIVFNDADQLRKLNEIVHPAVATHFTQWLAEQYAPFVVKEAAILFESGSYRNCDRIVSVEAPIELRIQRIVKRDNTTREAVLARMQNQWDDAKRAAFSDFILDNSDGADLETQVIELVKKLNNI